MGKNRGIALRLNLGIDFACTRDPLMESTMGIAYEILSYVECDTELTQTLGVARPAAILGSRPCILVIDDEELTRSTVRDMLEDAGYEVVEASDEASGIKLAHEQPPDLALVDIETDGLMTIAELRHDFPELNIIATSGADPRDPLYRLHNALWYGAAAVLRKPISRASLLRRVTEALSHDRPA